MPHALLSVGWPSSIWPSQSLSAWLPATMSLSQRVSGMMFPIASVWTLGLAYTQVQPPPAGLHVSDAPVAHAPSVSHSPTGASRSGSAVSISPSQSLSMPSHASLPVIVHGPNSQPSASTPLLLW